MSVSQLVVEAKNLSDRDVLLSDSRRDAPDNQEHLATELFG